MFKEAFQRDCLRLYIINSKMIVIMKRVRVIKAEIGWGLSMNNKEYITPVNIVKNKQSKLQ